MKIEPATSADAEAISALIIDLSGPFFCTPERTGAEAFLVSIGPDAQRRYLDAGNFAYHVARSDSGLAGVVALRDNAHLFHLFVARPFQGQGLARRLWEIVKGQAVQAGNPGRFTVNSSIQAVPVYERFGFVLQGDVQHMHGVSYQPMRMTLPMPDPLCRA